MNNPRESPGGGGAGAGRPTASRDARAAASAPRTTRQATAVAAQKNAGISTAGSGWTRKKKIAALSAIFGIIIGLGVTAAAGGTLYFTFQSQTDPFTASSAVELRNLNVVRDDDTLTVTGVLKNSGQTSISRLWIDNLAVSDIVAFQSLAGGQDPTATNDDLMLFVRHVDRDGVFMCISASGNSSVVTCPGTVGGTTIATAGGFDPFSSTISTREFDGISMDISGEVQEVESVLEGGRTQAFKIVIECDGPTGDPCNVVDISRDVAISDRLTLTFGYASGDDRLTSDAYSARVRSG